VAVTYTGKNLFIVVFRPVRISSGRIYLRFVEAIDLFNQNQIMPRYHDLNAHYSGVKTTEQKGWRACLAYTEAPNEPFDRSTINIWE
jgi:hypothetical protein